ncbi:MAG: SEC-C metal-binding domain-containing protein [Planctomycetes bacterium]|nr:SEC-C metal-binding domain-containing protein [Planctomycetota bacterium]
MDCIEVSPDDPDEIPNERFILSTIIAFFEAYNDLWQAIHAGQFSASWERLQDALDCLRSIKKFSNPPVAEFDFFECQLAEIEKLYPYKFFLSTANIVEYAECSICGQDINKSDCPHIMGELYRGRVAYGKVTSIAAVDHVAVVTHPEDKRLVFPSIEDNDARFRLVKYLSGLLAQARLSPLRFLRAKFSKRRQLNPDYVEQSRNELCRCGSGRKHKKCCLSKKYIEDHVDIICSQRSYSWTPVAGEQSGATQRGPINEPSDGHA